MLLGALVIATGCSMMRGGRDEPEPEAQSENGVSLSSGAVVLEGSTLKDGSGSVLAAMTGKVPNFRVRRTANSCPEISLRSNVNFNGFVNPHVYVDGTRATDTCILESLRADDVNRVEVYPLGFTTRPGYGTHSHGLILVFMRSI
jgi:hypothetical protein